MNKTEIIKQYKEIVTIKYNGNPPTFTLFKQQNPSLAWQIEKSGGYLHIKKLSGFQSRERKSPNYWSLKCIQDKISSIVKSNQFPTRETIYRNFGRGMTKAIDKIGGLKKLASIMGYELKSHLLCSDGHHVQSSYEYLLDEFLYHHKIPHEVGGFICDKHKFRYDFKIGNIYIEIWGYNSGNRHKSYMERRNKKENLYKSLKFTIVSLEAAWFLKPSIEDKFVEILKIINVQPSTITFPIKNYMHHTKYWSYKNTLIEFNNLKNKIGRQPCFKDIKTITGLPNAISRHGGLHFFNNTPKRIKKTNKQPVRHNLVKLWTEELIIKYLKELSISLGHFPNSNELIKLGYTGLLTALKKHGKINKFRKILGYSITKNNHNYWTEERIELELKPIIKELGRMPKAHEMSKSLCSAIYNNKRTIKYFAAKLCK